MLIRNKANKQKQEIKASNKNIRERWKKIWQRKRILV